MTIPELPPTTEALIDTVAIVLIVLALLVLVLGDRP